MSVTHDPSPGPTVLDRQSGDSPFPPRRHRRRLRRAARERRGAHPHRAARPKRAARRPGLRWRIAVASAGALLLTVCSGMALGVVSWTPSGLRIDFGQAPQGPPQVTGTDGVHPGGPARNISLSVQNTVAAAFEITAVHADLSGLDDACPGSAWQVGVPGLLPTVPARAEVMLPLPVTLVADAPDTCQGATVHFPVRVEGLRHPEPVPSVSGASSGSSVPSESSGVLRAEGIDATATVTAARLGSPGGAVSLRGGRIEITPTRAAGGPEATGHDVELVGADDRSTILCAASTATSCVDAAAPPAAPRRYVVVARVGSHWRRSSPVLSAWTPPPVPRLAFADGRPIGTALLLQASGGTADYDVDLIADGGSPFHSAHVSAGGSLDQTVAAPRLSPGTHRLVAVARYHGWQAPSAGLRLTVSGDGVSAAPGPSEEPAPVSADPDATDVPTTLPTGAPPTVGVPSATTTTVATRTTSLPSITIRTKPVAQPPVVSIDTTSSSSAPAQPDPAENVQLPGSGNPVAAVVVTPQVTP